MARALNRDAIGFWWIHEDFCLRKICTFNVTHNRNVPSSFVFHLTSAIKISSPQINNLIVCGCLLLYSSVFVSGLDTSGYSDTSIIIHCYAKVMLLCVGISMSFGSLLVKTYRIYAIFEKAVKKLKKIDLPDRKLMSVVCLLVLLDVLVVTLWFALGQTFVQTIHLDKTLVNPEREIYIVPILRQCGYIYEDYFTSALYGYKGTILVFGIFLAWETRKVNLKGLDDSKYIALSICTVGVTTSLTIPTLHVFNNNVDMHFCVYGIAVVFANTMVLCLVLVPKFHLCYSTRGIVLPTTIFTSVSDNDPPRKSRLIELQRELVKKKSSHAHLVSEFQASSSVQMAVNQRADE